MAQLCPCGSHLSYPNCCKKIHAFHAAAITPEQLMRARYSAHVLGLLDFVINTYHPSCQATQKREAIASALALTWHELQVLHSEIDIENQQGFVEFRAFYFENNKLKCLQERSRFVQEIINDAALWYYIDGTYSESKENLKVGRNDPCPCNSGKKFKKCCG